MNRQRHYAAALIVAAATMIPATVVGETVTAKLESIERIWDQAPHNAFTDLIQWRDHYVCAFREGRGHASTDGTIRVLASDDGNAWRSTASLSLDGYDLRDASLSITPDGRLLLNGGAAPRERDGVPAPTGTFVSFAKDVDEWTDPRIVVPPGRWLWRLTWSGDTAWGIDYAASENSPAVSLRKSTDGLTYETHVERLGIAGRPTEAVIRFAPDSTMVCLHRRDGKPDANSAMLGTSRPPYTAWQWRDLGLYFGGPNLIRTPAGHWIAAGRVIRDGQHKTVLAQLDVDAATLTPILELPSGGDTSYPGLVVGDDHVLVSYYSSHEGKTSIYLARVRLDE